MSILEIIGAIYIGLTIGGLLLFFGCIVNAKDFKDDYKNNNKEQDGTEERN